MFKCNDFRFVYNQLTEEECRTHEVLKTIIFLMQYFGFAWLLKVVTENIEG